MLLRTTCLDEVAGQVAALVPALHRRRAALVAVSGIDASGKGTVTAQLHALLDRQGLRVARIGLDPWHHPQTVRLCPRDAARHFYRHAFRWDGLFSQFLTPLREQRSITLRARLIETARDHYYDYTYDFADVDVILLEGIFLLKRQFRARYDFAVWVECSARTALDRALRRNQEGLPPEQILADYRRVYFPAQCLHVLEDDPVSSADAVFVNEKPARVRAGWPDPEPDRLRPARGAAC